MILPGLGETSLRRIVQAIRDMGTGGTNALANGPVDLAAGDRTVVGDARCGPDSVPVVVPLDAAAAAAQVYVMATAAGSFTLGHLPGAGGRRVTYELRRP
ncbi:hypothetical protein [Methylobacterium sp. JK268]